MVKAVLLASLGASSDFGNFGYIFMYLCLHYLAKKV